MSRRCDCTRACLHLVPSRHYEPLLKDAALVELDAVLATLVDAADSFDSNGLVINALCEVHGEMAVSNAVCICRGERYSAVEFIQALALDVREAVAQRRPGRRVGSRDETPEARARRSLGQQRRWSRVRSTGLRVAAG